MKRFDAVYLKEELEYYSDEFSSYKKLPKNSGWTILEIYDNDNYEVEFADDKWKTLHIVVIHNNKLKLKKWK